MSRGYDAISQLGTNVAPTAAVRSGSLTVKGDTHLTLEAECDADATLRLYTVRRDGSVGAALAEYPLTAGEPFVRNDPIALGAIQVEIEAAADGWVGYCTVRTGRRA